MRAKRNGCGSAPSSSWPSATCRPRGRHLKPLLAADPGHVMARLRLSMLATNQGRYRDSVTQLLAIAELRPAEPELLVLLAGMLHRLGEARAAITCLSQPSLAAARDKPLLQHAAQLASQWKTRSFRARLARPRRSPRRP